MRKHPRNDVEKSAGQIVYCVCGKMTQQQCMENWEAECEDVHFVPSNPVKQGKPLVKELSEYEEICRKNNSENSR